MYEQYWNNLKTVISTPHPPPPPLQKKPLKKLTERKNITIPTSEDSLLDFFYLSIPDKWSIKSLAKMPVCDISEDSC